MLLRKHFITPNARVTEMTCSVLDYRWTDAIENKKEVLVIAEGFLMYLDESDVKALMHRIADCFFEVTLLIELMSLWMVENQKVHEVVRKIGATFCWGVNNTTDFCVLCPQFDMTGDYNLTPVMKQYAKLFITLISWYLTPRNNRIGKFVKKASTA